MQDSGTSASTHTIAVTGATGLIGGALVSRLRARGHEVRRLVRASTRLGEGDIPWDPQRGVLAPASLEGVDAVVHLAGEPVARRWNSARKEAIRASRVQGTQLIARTVAALHRRPTVLLSGSAVGYYGDRGDEVLDESSGPGSDFLARVCLDWEGATTPAVDAGVRVVLLRTGVVLSDEGGALEKLLPPFRLGLGGPIGTGAQWLSWITLEDELRAIEHALNEDSARGPVNLVAPTPVTNAEFAATLGRVLQRPAVVPVPAFALELLYGEMAGATVLASQRVLPRALERTGFEFASDSLEKGLRRILRR
ncbi:MAG: hypothetical protein JWN53_1893 [Gemmatimonadetes bacterium]|nr:hypothetical protein [Gemmatimonadota bacterium]